MKNEKRKHYIPIICIIAFCLAAVSLGMELYAHKSVSLADTIDGTSGHIIRMVLAKITGIFPLSLCEILIVLSPVLLALLIIILVKKSRKSLKALIRFTAYILAVASLVYTLYVFGYGTGYYGSTIDKKMGFNRVKLSAQDLYDTSLIMLGTLEGLIDGIDYPEGTYSRMPFTYGEMNRKLNDAYKKLCADYPVIYNFTSVTKPVLLSEPWTYTHISGLYSFFTGEANININYPDFIIVSSAAHEMAHQRGVTREDEANFVSFLVCSYSDDPFVKYAGYLDVFREVKAKLYSADETLWKQLSAQVPSEINEDIMSFALFFDKYRDNAAAKVNDAINDSYIQSHNQPAGLQSYGLVVDLAAAYLLGK